MVLNTAGFVQPFDLGIPHFITARAAAVVSGGQYVYATSGTAFAVSSGLNSLIFGDLEVTGGASGVNFPVGVAVHNAGSLDPVAVCTDGFVISTANGALANGMLVTCTDGANSVMALASGTGVSSANSHRTVGRAWLAAASGAHTLVKLRL